MDEFQPSQGMFDGPSTTPFLTGRPAKLISLSCDPDTVSAYQTLVRKQIELFETDCEEAKITVQGRNKPISLGQVGIRCRHCACLHPLERTRGAAYFPSTLEGLYQAGQNLATGHLLQYCQNIPLDIREELEALKDQKSTAAGGGKKHWAETAKALGVYEDTCNEILRFEHLKPIPTTNTTAPEQQSLAVDVEVEMD